MRLALTGRGVDITPALRKLVERKLARLERVLSDKGVSGQVELRLEKFRRVSELRVHVRGGHMFQAIAAATTWEISLADATDKIVQQVQTLKGKWQERKREGRPARRSAEAAIPAAQVRRIVRARRYPVRALTLEAAAQQVGPSTDAFVVFRNPGTDAISVLYRRKDGDLGLIEPQA
ncbi:MAG: ribosome-associated translation inhibitor RaiA [Acidobacteria bacterium]|nr:ribosome-associated translation inhibitor RaiA [Acidobacteriota bacterium]